MSFPHSQLTPCQSWRDSGTVLGLVINLACGHREAKVRKMTIYPNYMLTSDLIQVKAVPEFVRPFPILLLHQVCTCRSLWSTDVNGAKDPDCLAGQRKLDQSML